MDKLTTNMANKLLVFTSLGMVIFAGLYFNKPSPSAKNATTAAQIVTNTITMEVVKEVPKEVQKIVSVPAEIPSEYIDAYNLKSKMLAATSVSNNGVLFNIKDVRVRAYIPDEIKKHISQEEVQARFELTLRRYNVPVNAETGKLVCIQINCFYPDELKNYLLYQIDSALFEEEWVFRDGNVRKAFVTTWQSRGVYGRTGVNNISDVILKKAEKDAELFANDYLNANQK